MKRPLIHTLVTAALTALLAVPAAAQPGPGDGPPPPDGPPPFGPHDTCNSPRHQAALEKYDANKDGVLDRAERRQMMEDHHKMVLAKYDTNKNGKLDRKERAAFMHDELVSHFEELDTNHDADISLAEAKAGCGPLKFYFDQVDTDKNGLVSWDEFEKVARRHPPGPRHGRHHRGPRGAGGPQRRAAMRQSPSRSRRSTNRSYFASARSR